MKNSTLQAILRQYPPDTDVNINSYDWDGVPTEKDLLPRDIQYNKKMTSILLEYDPPRTSEDFHR